MSNKSNKIDQREHGKIERTNPAEDAKTQDREHLPLPLEKARAFDSFGHAGFDPSGKIRMTP